MALAEDPPAPGASGDPLEEFLGRFTVPDPDHRLDAADVLKAYRGWLIDQQSPLPPPNAALYARLRLQGHIVVRGAQNRQWLAGLTLRPHVLPAWNRLLGLADQPPPPRAAAGESMEVTMLARDLRTDAAQLGREALVRLLGKSIDTLEQTLDDPDAKVRQSSALAVIRSFVPQAKAREIANEVIDVNAPEQRASLADIEAVFRAQLAMSPDQGETLSQEPSSS
jgi:hypothetical protein